MSTRAADSVSAFLTGESDGTESARPRTRGDAITAAIKHIRSAEALVELEGLEDDELDKALIAARHVAERIRQDD